tara:strand:- start:775 stop:1794 length:1020 start_codon:yes stop_codon:yes gene_type:complete
MLFQKDSFFDPIKITNINDGHKITILPPENEVLPVCISKSRINTGGNSLNFILEYTNKKILLKAVKKNLSNHEFLFKNSTLLKSIFNTPQPVKFLTGKYTYEDENFIWLQQEFIVGEYFSGDKQEFGKVIELIASLYKYRIKISNIFSKNLNEIIYDHKNIEKQFFNYVCQFKKESKLFETLPIKSQKLISSKKLKPINFYVRKEEMMACHIDLHPQNMIIDKNKNIFILDIASITNFPIKVAYSFAIFKNFRHYVAKSEEFNNESVNFFREAVYSIFSEDYIIEEILKSAQVEYMRRANNVFSEIVNGGKSKWIENLSVQLAGVCETSHVFYSEQESL